ncbi:PDZ domain-containing protein [Roseateles sp. LKC17W]|uniref:PDZ domain-containing protein n=1 Tax=Pelomonas margarita TaxID=3299031 RepID=A0ABW7FFT0_9BURK
MQSNKGVVVRTVVEGTPAYLADVLPDDIIIAVDGNAVLGQAELSRLLTERAGREVTLTVYRNGTQRPIAVKLN